MKFLYLAFVSITEFLLSIAAVFIKKGKLSEFIKGQKKTYPALPSKTGKRYWFHCASLGEFEQARPVIEALKLENAGTSIVITFFSPSGYSQKHDYPLADAVIYLPLDKPRNARKLLDYLQADAAIFVKYEIWFFHLSELFKRRIPVYLISATFRPGQYILSFWGKWLFKVLPRYEQIFLQDKASYALLEKKGLKNISVSGDTRYDRVRQNALQVKENQIFKDFKGSHKLIILGSSWPPEEDILLEYLLAHSDDKTRIIIAPHDISTSHITDIYNKFKSYQPIIFTGISGAIDTRILILDTIGHLASSYFYAELAFIGGAFGKGLHNILEPLAFGAPVIFGPDYQRYPEAALAMEGEVAISISNAAGFEHAITVLSEKDRPVKCIDFINWHSGATDKVVQRIKKGLD